MIRRDYADAAYQRFRYGVRARDHKTCKWPDCGKKRKLNVHHILPWQNFPLLRYEVSNGITLCNTHHKQVTGHELTYAKFLSSLI